MKTFEELKAELLQNPEVLAEYERLRPEFEQETLIGCYRCKLAVFGEWGDITPDNRIVEKTAAVLATLTPREAKVLRMRFGIDMPTDHTLEEVGKQFGVTRERIRQIEAKALRKLRHPKRSVIWRREETTHQEELQKIFGAQIVSITELSRECIRCGENLSSENIDVDDQNLCNWCGHHAAKNRDEAA